MLFRLGTLNMSVNAANAKNFHVPSDLAALLRQPSGKGKSLNGGDHHRYLVLLNGDHMRAATPSSLSSHSLLGHIASRSIKPAQEEAGSHRNRGVPGAFVATANRSFSIRVRS